MRMRKFAGVSLLCGVLCLSLSGCGKRDLFTPADRTLAGEYPAEVATAKREGIPLSIKELRKPMPPADKNAGPIYAALKNTKISEADDKRLEAFVQLDSPTPQQIAQAQATLQRSAPTLRLIHEVATRPECVFQRDWNTDNPSTIELPELAAIRNSARLLRYESILLAYQGKGEDAIRNQALGFAMAQHARSDALLISWLVGQAVDALTLSGMQKIITIHSDTRTVQAAAQTLAQKRKILPLAPALESEIAFQQSELERARKIGYFAFLSEMNATMTGNGTGKAKTTLPETRVANEKVLLDASATYMLRWMRKLRDAADLPYAKAKPIFDACEKDVNTVPLGEEPVRAIPSILIPVFSNVLGKRAAEEARYRTLQAGVAVLAYRNDHNGTLPETLDAALSPAPTDPFTEKPLQYRREETGKDAGFVIYSSGPDGTFDGGSPGVKVKGVSNSYLFRYRPTHSP